MGTNSHIIELELKGAECTPSEKEKEPEGVDPFAVIHYGSQHYVARLMKGLY